MSKDITVPVAEGLLIFEPENLMGYVARVLRQDPTPEFREWLALHIENGRIILAPASKGRPVDVHLDARIMRFVELDNTFDREVKMDAMIAALKERQPGLGRKKARELIKAGLDLRESSEAAQRGPRK